MIDWSGDKPLKTKKEKLEFLDAALAPHMKTPEEQAVLRCPVCGSHNWGSAAGIMWCARCKCHCNGNPLWPNMTCLADWINPEYPKEELRSTLLSLGYRPAYLDTIECVPLEPTFMAVLFMLFGLKKKTGEVKGSAPNPGWDRLGRGGSDRLS
jgi:hypothetical protein